MKDIILLIRQRKEFYLTVLVLTILLTIIGALYNISVVGKNIAELNVDLVTKEQLEIMVAQQESMFREGMSSQGLMMGFFNNYTYMGYVALNLVIAAVLLLSYSDRSEKAAKEFLETLPVKKIALELYNYIALIGIFLINILVALGIHLALFTQYNGKIVTLAERFPNVLGALVPDNLVVAHNISLLYQFGMLTLFLLTMITLIMVCMAIFKNGVAGFFVGAVLWNTADDVLCTVRTLFTDASEYMTDSFRQVVAAINPQWYFDRFAWNGGVCTNDFTTYVAVALVIMLLVMIAAFIAHAYCRELSGGKILYLSSLNIVMLIVFGFWLLISLIGSIGYSVSKIVTATCIAVVAEIIVIMILYHKKDKIYKLMVKESRKVKNPVLAQGFRSFLIASGAIALGVVWFDFNWNIISLKDAMSYIDFTVWIPEEPLHLVYFDTHFRYQYAVPILVGFIIFKCIRFVMDRPKARREFYETLPMSRIRMFCTKLLMDLGVIVIPLAVYVTVSIGYLVSFNHRMHWLYPELEITAMVEEQFVTALIVLCVAVALLGVLYLIDAVTVSGGMKNLFCSVTALFIFVLSLLVMENNMYIFWDELVAVFWGEPTVVSAIVYLLLGIGMLIAAGYLYVRRDAGKEIFYYKSVKYVFASMLSASYLFFVMFGAMGQALYQYILAVIGTVLIFFLTVYYCTPGHMAELQKKFQKKKIVK